MGTSVDPAYIERLQEDIVIACRRLEENGHESLVVTISEEGHLIFGSEKGKRFLLDKHVFILDFMQCCQNTKPTIKIERDIAEDIDIEEYNKQKIEKKKTSSGINKGVNRTKSSNHATAELVDATLSETDNFDADTDNYDDTENEDTSFISTLETESDNRTVDQVTEGAVKTEAGKEIVAVKKESLLDTQEKSTHCLKQMPEARIVLTKIKEINSSQKTGLRTKQPQIKPSTLGKKSNSGTPKCDICGKNLATWNGLRRHQIVFHQENWDFECDICGKKFKVHDNLTRHRAIHGAPEHKCKKCSYETCDSSNFTIHIKLRHTEDSDFPCEDCGKSFRNKLYLDQHRRRIHCQNKMSQFKCPFEACGKTFIDSFHLTRHAGTHEKWDALKCKICGKQCNCNSKLERHMRCHTDRTRKKTIHECEVCDKVFSCKGNLEKHMVQHTNIKPYVCERCGKTFSSKQYFDNHTRIHTGEKPYKCTFEGCNKTFRTYENHRRHMCYHSDTYPFICDICGQKFKERSCMKHHRKKHTSECRWPCDYCSEKFSTLVRFKTHIIRFHVEKKDEVAANKNMKFWPCDTCPKVFGAKEDYEQHVNVHLGYKPFKCSVCDKGFSSKSNLLQHMKLHIKYNRLRCTLCSKTYSDPKRLKEHMLNRHNQEVSLDDIRAGMNKGLPVAVSETKVEQVDSENVPVPLSERNNIAPPVSHIGSRNIEQVTTLSGKNNDEEQVPIINKPVIHSIVTPLFSIPCPASRLDPIRTEGQFLGQ